jgi:bifunctional DNase/RNase
MTHDLLRDVIATLGATVSGIAITRVEGTTFFAQVNLIEREGQHHSIDSRPSDAIALALRTKAPIWVAEDVMQTASYPDFTAVEKDEESKEAAEFHDFVENLTPEDFSAEKH